MNTKCSLLKLALKKINGLKWKWRDECIIGGRIKRHSALSARDMRERIINSLGEVFSSNGYEKIGNDSWIRPKDKGINNIIRMQINSKRAPEVYGVLFYLGIQSKGVQSLISDVTKEKSKKSDTTFSILHYNAFPCESVKRKWCFWNIDFSNKEIEKVKSFLEDYAFVFLDEFSSLDSIIPYIESEAEIEVKGPAKIAASYFLSGDHDKAVYYLESVINKRRNYHYDDNQLEYAHAMLEYLRTTKKKPGQSEPPPV